MAQRIESPRVTIAAGTVQSAPVSTALPFPEGIVKSIEIVIPPGPSGLMGFVITHSGVQVIPRAAGQFIVADDKYFVWPLEDFPVGAKWACLGYNTDIYPHTIQFHFHIDEIMPVVPLFPGQLALG